MTSSSSLQPAQQPVKKSAEQPAKKILVATSNAHKVDEIRAAMSAVIDAEFITLKDVDPYDEPIEDGETFLENARIKAYEAHKQTGLAVIADDSGLIVDALHGAPGVHSARYAEAHNDQANNAKLLKELTGVPYDQRTARFASVIVYLDEDGREVVGTGFCEGTIGFEPKGSQGFGYDPLFIPDAVSPLTMAEISMADKNALSHRGYALQDLVAKLTAEL